LSLTLWFGDSLGETQGIIAVLSVVTFVIGWGIGLGAVAWVVLTEIIPTNIRSKAYSLFVSAMWLCSFTVGFLTLTAIDGLGGVDASMSDTTKTNHQKTGCGILYFIYTVFAVVSLIYMHFELPETKGKTAEEMRPERETLTAGDATHNPMSSPAKTNNSSPKKKMYKGSSQGLQENLISGHEL
jgi:MFS family permease